jgi:hypothetical protein
MTTVKPLALTAYVNLSILVVSIPGVLLENAQMLIWDLPIRVFLVIACLAGMMVIVEFTRILGIKNLSINQYSIFMQMGLLLQIIIDVFLLDYSFTKLQILGFVIMLSLYVTLFSGVCCGHSKIASSF